MLHWLTISTPLGPMRAAADLRGLRVLDFADRRNMDRHCQLAESVSAAAGPARLVFSPADPQTTLRLVAEGLERYFAGAGEVDPAGEVRLAPVNVTAFRRRAWAALRQIPYAQCQSYTLQADAVCGPVRRGAGGVREASNHVRAVAAANAANYLSLIIPCHRVIGRNGQPVGYGGGVQRKRWLNAFEQEAVTTGLFADGLARTGAAGLEWPTKGGL